MTPEDETETDFIVAPKGTRLPVTPKFKFSATARYAWMMGPGRAHVQAGLVYNGKARAALGTAEQEVTGNLPAYTLVDLFAGYEWSKYSVELFATNLFDSNGRYSTSVQCQETVCGDPDGISSTGGVFYDYVIKPRTVGLKVGFDF